MADNNNRTRFSLTQLRTGINRRAEEMLSSENAEIRSLDDKQGPRKPYAFQSTDYDRTEAPKDDMRKYWRQYETTPIVRKPISSFASQVMEPGYYINSDIATLEQKNKLLNWLEECAIIEGMPGKDFRLLAKKAVIQREVRGTALIEKAPDSRDKSKIAGLKLINPETVEAVTRPGQSILLAPEDIKKYDDAPKAETGGAAAYLQDISETDALFGIPVRKANEDNKIGFQRDEIIKLTRDADVGEIFGTSRIESVSDRIDGIKKKLADNDEAIASKAYPLWLFKFGTEEQPWDAEDIRKFMSAHEMSKFHPGMKQGVRGDVEVDTISGEVADIAQALNFDMNWIISAMPMPKFVLGAFESTGVGQISGVAQQQDVNRQINEARRELEDEFTPVVRQVAEQLGFDEAVINDVRLKIGREGEPDITFPRNEQVIRYISGSGAGGDPRPNPPQASEQPTSGEDVIDGDEPLGIDEEDKTPYVDYVTGEPESNAARIWYTDEMVEELGEGVEDQNKLQLGSEIGEIFKRARDETLERLSTDYEGVPTFAISQFENVANREMNLAMSTSNLRKNGRALVEDEVNDLIGLYNLNTNSFSHSQRVNYYTQNIENATRDALDEMMRSMRIQVRRGVEENQPWESIVERVMDVYNDTYLVNRATLIAHMELKNAIETSKLAMFEQDPDVIGVRIVNNNQSTPLTRALNGAEAFFNHDLSLSEQWMGYADSAQLHKGFNPIPATPPFHFNDTSVIEPIYGGEE